MKSSKADRRKQRELKKNKKIELNNLTKVDFFFNFLTK